ncbi:hypothetical protein QFC21_004859 [Naganishia friedmannii]|uniref:Uncharacterized protein n=1 Tax=Naganishia friedmannii TaxID=89922 RepID=A0ACC2VDM3_9TREE|nr:hypothetical protein QFC21_004859 [Naganishia friedmannii]
MRSSGTFSIESFLKRTPEPSTKGEAASTAGSNSDKKEGTREDTDSSTGCKEADTGSFWERSWGTLMAGLSISHAPRLTDSGKNTETEQTCIDQSGKTPLSNISIHPTAAESEPLEPQILPEAHLYWNSKTDRVETFERQIPVDDISSDPKVYGNFDRQWREITIHLGKAKESLLETRLPSVKSAKPEKFQWTLKLHTYEATNGNMGWEVGLYAIVQLGEKQHKDLCVEEMRLFSSETLAVHHDRYDGPLFSVREI